MKCPDCGTRLSEIMAEGVLCHRCFKCGGFFAGSNVINRLTASTVGSWRRIKIDATWLSGGKGLCPQDGTMLQRYGGKEVPGRIEVKRCIRCGKWWFPGDALHEFKPAQEAKSLYFRLWDITQDAASLVLPVIAGIVVVGGLAAGLVLVRQPQQMQVPAMTEPRLISVEKIGETAVSVRIRSRENIEVVQYRVVGTEEWRVAPTELSANGVTYEVRLEGLRRGERYEVKTEAGSIEFVAGD